MTDSPLAEIVSSLSSGEIVPYIGPRTLQGVVNTDTGAAMPTDSDSLILALNNGQPMAPRLMYEFPRAAMHVENKRGRKHLERFLDQLYGETHWSVSPLHQWIAGLHAPYVIDINRDTQLQTLYRDRDHTLIVGAARIAGTHYRFDIYLFRNGTYQRIEQEAIDPKLPILFKPMGSPLPKPSYVASDADYVDYISELMGGFAVPRYLKEYRPGRRYLLLGMNFNRDTERMVFGDMIYGADDPAGWALIPGASDKEVRFCNRKGIQVLNADWQKLMSATPARATA